VAEEKKSFFFCFLLVDKSWRHFSSMTRMLQIVVLQEKIWALGLNVRKPKMSENIRSQTCFVHLGALEIGVSFVQFVFAVMV
jgi:hypothetical protein